MNEMRTRIPLFFFLGLLLISAIYYGFVFMPMQDEISAVKQQRDQAQQTLDMYQSYSANLGGLQQNVAALKGEIDSALAVKYKVNAHNLPEDVQAAIAASGITLSGLQINTPQSINSTGNFGIYQLPVSISFQCANIRQAFALLHYFEQSDNSYFYVSNITTDDVMRSFGVRLNLLLYYPEAMGATA